MGLEVGVLVGEVMLVGEEGLLAVEVVVSLQEMVEEGTLVGEEEVHLQVIMGRDESVTTCCSNIMTQYCSESDHM